MTPKLEQIRYTLDELNVELIQKVLANLGVKWTDSKTGEKRVPTADEIEAVAEHCMLEAFNSEDGTFEMGGFEAKVEGGIVEVKFVLAKSNPLSKLLA